jgi:methyl-accepting chemotaxis protein-1 (serine sensor receptor)
LHAAVSVSDRSLFYSEVIMFFFQQRLNRQLTIAFSILVAIIMVISALAVFSLSQAQSNFDGFVGDEFNRGSVARDVRSAVSARAIAARNLILLKAPADIESEKAAVLAAHERVKDRMLLLKKLLDQDKAASAREHELYQELVGIEQQYGPVALAIVDLALTGKTAEATDKMNAECQPLLKKLIATVGEYAKLIASSAEHEIQKSADKFRTKRMLLVCVSLVAVATAVALASLIKRSLHRSLGADPQDLRKAANQVSSGDLSTLHHAAEAPANSVMASLGEMQQSLANIVSSVRGSSDTIESGSTEIADRNKDLSARTEDQARQLQQSASAMEKITETIRLNADTAARASDLALSARAAAENGGAMVGQVVSTMQNITASSRKIEDIISVIDGIAFQTNILALNAAVEAARAGEQGRGFAVVASEVRALAHRSAQAAKEIKELIVDSVSMIDSGAGLVSSAGEAMNEIVTEVKSVAVLISEISTATREQTVSIGSIGETVIALDRGTQQNSSLVQQMADAADTLNQQAHSLVSAVSVFKVTDGESMKQETGMHRSNRQRQRPLQLVSAMQNA